MVRGMAVVLVALAVGLVVAAAQSNEGTYYTRTSTASPLSADSWPAIFECLLACSHLAFCTHTYYGATDGVCTTVTSQAIQIARNTDIVYRKDATSSGATTTVTPGSPGGLGPPLAPETPGTPAAPTSTSCYNSSVAYTGTHANSFGIPCMLWMEINEPQYTDDDFPYDGSVFGASNYCRAPRASTNDPFCYTQGKTADRADMRFCDVPTC